MRFSNMLRKSAWIGGILFVGFAVTWVTYGWTPKSDKEELEASLRVVRKARFGPTPTKKTHFVIPNPPPREVTPPVTPPMTPPVTPPVTPSEPRDRHVFVSGFQIPPRGAVPFIHPDAESNTDAESKYDEVD